MQIARKKPTLFRNACKKKFVDFRQALLLLLLDWLVELDFVTIPGKDIYRERERSLCGQLLTNPTFKLKLEKK